MSTPIPMPLPQPYPVSVPSSHQPGALDTSTPTTAGNPNMSPSNHSTQSSSAFPQPSTAATSPVSSFHQANNANPHHHNLGAAAHVHNPHSVTRILLLSDFSKDLKTRDIQLVFSEWEDERGGFKIKWIDDTSCLVVFADPGVAKRAFLGTLSHPPSSLVHHDSNGQIKVAQVRAYNGPDVPHVLASVQNRPRSRSNASQSLHSRASSLASANNGPLGRRPSMGTLNNNRHRASLSSASGIGARQNNIPINPIVQAQVQELIDHVTTQHGSSNHNTSPRTSNHQTGTGHSDVGLETPTNTSGGNMRPRVEDAGKRFITAGFGKPNGSIAATTINELDEIGQVGFSLGNWTIEEEATTPTAASH